MFGFKIENADNEGPFDYRPPSYRQVATEKSGTF